MISIAVAWLIFLATFASYELFALGMYMASLPSDIAVAAGFGVAVFGPACVIISAATIVAKVINKKGTKE